MADIALRIAADFKQAEKAFKAISVDSEVVQKKFKQLAESSKKVESAMARSAEKNKLNAIAIRATRGETAALIAEKKGLQRQIVNLIKSGISPESVHVKKLQKDYTRLSSQIKKTSKMKSELIGKMKLFASVGAGLVVGILTRKYIEFDQAITSASAKFSDLDLATTEGQKKLKQLGETARQVGADTQFSANEAAEGLDFLAMAGFNTRQALSLLPGVADLATVANIGLARSTDIASDSLGAFDLMTKDTIQLQENFIRIQDVMAKTMTSSNTNMEQLFESIQKGAPAFTAAGQEIETFSSLVGVMANSGLKGAESGTQLRNIIIRLSKPTSEASKVMDKLGISTQDSEGNFKDMISIIQDFEVKLKGMGTAQRSSALATVFGARSMTAMNILINEGGESLGKYRKELMNSGGAAKDMADIMRSSLGNRLKIISSQLVDIGFVGIEAILDLGDAFMIAGKDSNVLVESLKWVVNGLANIIRYAAQAANEIKALTTGNLAEKQREDAEKIMKANADILSSYKGINDLKKKSADISNIQAQIDLKAFNENSKLFRDLSQMSQNSLNDSQKYLDKQAELIKKIKGGQDSVKELSDARSKAHVKEVEQINGKSALLDKASRKRKTASELALEAMKKEEEAYKLMLQSISTGISAVAGVFSSIGNLMAALNQKAIAGIDRRMNAELRAAGLAEKTQVEQAKSELAAAIETGDALAIVEKQRILDKSVIEQKYFKERQKMEYEAANSAWKMQVAASIAQAAINVLTAAGSGWKLGPFGAGTYAALAGVQSAIQLGSVVAAKPTAPSAETGISNYTVPEIRSTRNDGAAVMAQGGETVSVTPKGESSGGTNEYIFQVGESRLFKFIQKGIDTGKIKLSDKNIGRSAFAT